LAQEQLAQEQLAQEQVRWLPGRRPVLVQPEDRGVLPAPVRHE